MLPLGPRLLHRRQHQKKNWLCSIKGALRTRCRARSDNLLTPALKTTNGSTAYILIDSLLSVKSIAEGGLSISQLGTVLLCAGVKKNKRIASLVISKLASMKHLLKIPFKAIKQFSKRLNPAMRRLRLQAWTLFLLQYPVEKAPTVWNHKTSLSILTSSSLVCFSHPKVGAICFWDLSPA